MWAQVKKRRLDYVEQQGCRLVPAPALRSLVIPVLRPADRRYGDPEPAAGYARVGIRPGMAPYPGPIPEHLPGRCLFAAVGAVHPGSVHCCLDRHPAGIPPGLLPGFSCREKILALTATLAILPFWTSYLLRVIAWKTILGSNGLINNLLIYLGLVDEPVRILLYSRLAVILTLVYVWLPFVALPIYASLQRISPSLLEAAAILKHPRGSHFSGDPAVKPAGCDCRFFHGIDPHRGGIYYPTQLVRHRSTLYGNIIELYFGDGANWPLGSAMSVVMLAGFFFLALIVSRFVDFKRFVE